MHADGEGWGKQFSSNGFRIRDEKFRPEETGNPEAHCPYLAEAAGKQEGSPPSQGGHTKALHSVPQTSLLQPCREAPASTTQAP